MQSIPNFKIPKNRFDRIHKPEEADFLIFDLDNPPQDWIRYIGAHYKHTPDHENIIFVCQQLDQEISEFTLDGNQILYILNRSYKEGYQFYIASTENDMQRMLSTLEINLKKRKQIDKQSTLQALASIR